MSLISLQFLAFLAVLAALYYLLPACCRPWLLLAGSLAFYLSFDKRYALFLAFSVFTVYGGALRMGRTTSAAGRRGLLAAVLGVNIGLLAAVKYLPWCVGLAGSLFGFAAPGWVGGLLVPVGISFYTLQVGGYAVDVYRGKYPPEKNLLHFASFAAFFPLMLQGPISRFDQLAPQLARRQRLRDAYENITAGARLMLWGFFQKLVIADRAALLVDPVFRDPAAQGGGTAALAVLLYTVQIYADFSGCVDICRGAAKLFGVDLIQNFRQPYFATSIQDFWRRWHISLSSWLKDYLYIPLGGNRKGTARKYGNLLIVFFVSGLWHGVGVHFILWGLLQGVFQILGALTLPAKKRLCAALHINREAGWFKGVQRCSTFLLVNLSWLLFRANGTRAAADMLAGIFRSPGSVALVGLDLPDCLVLCGGAVLLWGVDYYRHKGCSVGGAIAKTVLPVRWTIYLAALAAVLVFGIYGPGYAASSFIYMNF